MFSLAHNLIHLWRLEKVPHSNAFLGSNCHNNWSVRNGSPEIHKFRRRICVRGSQETYCQSQEDCAMVKILCRTSDWFGGVVSSRKVWRCIVFSIQENKSVLLCFSLHIMADPILKIFLKQKLLSEYFMCSGSLFFSSSRKYPTEAQHFAI